MSYVEPNILPFDELFDLTDEGYSPSTIIAPDSRGCTGATYPDYTCLNLSGSGLHVNKISGYVYDKDQSYDGRWRATRNGNLFLLSKLTTFTPPDEDWEWDKGWTFNDGDIIRLGFWKSTGGYIAHGPAALTVHA